ncbi:glycosyl transferase [Alteromonas halophila]|uniref:Glycosyl transferase n=2 Tax=Alteromonas halophila TaxID=516698 RepID=A0A918JK19_9ALTE|nr:glycosyl transferase [Alteromonas halophila]
MRLSAIGDVCHAVAMINRIQTHWPDAEITWVIGKIEYQLVRLMPNVRFIIFDKSQGRDAVRQLRQAVAGETFDALLMMQVALRANLASRVIRAKQRIGFDWARSKELHWLFANKRVAPHQHAHVLDGFMDFADALGVPPVSQPQWQIPVSDEDRRWAQQQADRLGDFVVISPTASKAQRNWLPQRYASIARYLFEKGKAVVLCGGPGVLDKQTAAQIQTFSPPVAADLTGQTSLHQLLALLSHAQLVIAPDTGPAHMATTVGTPVIGLYAHSNPRRTGPYRDLDKVVSVYDQCIEEQQGKPWTALPWGVRAKGDSLMARIDVAQVEQAIDRVLG